MDTTTENLVRVMERTFRVNSIGPVLRYEKFEASRPEVQARFMRLWDAQTEQMSQYDRTKLHELMAPFCGSLDAIQWNAIKVRREWSHVWRDLARRSPAR